MEYTGSDSTPTTDRAVTLSAGGGTVQVDNPASTNLNLNGVISGQGSFTKAGPGTLTFTGNNTYSGATTISAGTLQLGNGAAGHDGSLATSGITNNATLAYDPNLARRPATSSAAAAAFPWSGRAG